MSEDKAVEMQFFKNYLKLYSRFFNIRDSSYDFLAYLVVYCLHEDNKIVINSEEREEIMNHYNITNSAISVYLSKLYDVGMIVKRKMKKGLDNVRDGSRVYKLNPNFFGEKNIKELKNQEISLTCKIDFENKALTRQIQVECESKDGSVEKYNFGKI